MTKRTAVVTRETKEVKLSVSLNIDGKGKGEINTGVGMLDHLLLQISRHGLIDITISAEGDLHVDEHHTAEDVAIALGQAFDKALGERRGIRRMANAVVPMDESLAMVALDISGRGYAVVEAAFSGSKIGELPADIIKHMLESFASAAKINLHAIVLAGQDDHHKAEALFKALARALDEATQIDTRIKDDLPSTKGMI
ncbi:MAG: imidazoleglycerol-phosphate dehydratase HisB [Chloroflexi bacterium]|jgi:imidazoleglycerol-phosphate dehydratase|nr:imidazoleglycerol-phosphate dehydratase HisB [Chloroflexota bacterium]MBT7081208.1 imidazoleglycerol-phosphate dehydratase HisB [Chloroflexota bacterium]MBT7290263.1 imidazoleglycerol-phosphate dehydratase HisB [Chloroflexota bacterium]